MEKYESVYVSFGENCLTDDILKRYKLKSFSTPFSSGRSNIEYILQIEKDNYTNFLNTEYMRYEPLNDKDMLRLKFYNKISNQYDTLSMNGFEFTHHDVMADPVMMEKLQRRCNRLLNLNAKRMFIFYHHRYCKNTDRKMLLEHLNELKKLYRKRCSNVKIIMFTQVLVRDKSQRKMEHHFVNGIHLYVFYTLKIWGGSDPDILWARCDDDLISQMINEINEGLKGNSIISKFAFAFKYKIRNQKCTLF